MRVSKGTTGQSALAVGALGVVFGDIGTSPLYTVQTVFNPGDPHPVTASTEDSVFGIISLIFWSVTIIVTIKYVLLVMRADNDGEGGIMALITLIRRSGVPGRAADQARARGARHLRRLAVLRRQHDHAGDLGPLRGRRAQGRRTVAGDLVVPITAAIIVVLFALQRFGTGAVGRLFGPVMVVWFARDRRAAASAASPRTRRSSRRSRRATPWASCPATSRSRSSRWPPSCSRSPAPRRSTPTWGTSAAPPITRAWLLLVFPACILNYMGQGALILGNPAQHREPVLPARPRAGRSCRWSSWRPWRPSSPRRR